MTLVRQATLENVFRHINDIGGGGGNPSNLKKKYHLKLELFMSICRDFHILMWLSPLLIEHIHTSCGLLLSGYLLSIY